MQGGSAHDGIRPMGSDRHPRSFHPYSRLMKKSVDLSFLERLLTGRFPVRLHITFWIVLAGAAVYFTNVWTDTTSTGSDPKYTYLPSNSLSTIAQVCLQNSNQYASTNHPSDESRGHFPVQSQPLDEVSGSSAVSSSTPRFCQPAVYNGLWSSAQDPPSELTSHDVISLIAQYNTSAHFSVPHESSLLKFHTNGVNFFPKVVSVNHGSAVLESPQRTVHTLDFRHSRGENPSVMLEAAPADVQVSLWANLDLSSVPEPSTTLALGMLIMSGLLIRSRSHTRWVSQTGSSIGSGKSEGVIRC